MKFKSFHKYNRKISLWSGATALFITTVILIIVLSIPLPDSKLKLMVAVHTILNEFLIWAFLSLANRSAWFLRFITQVNVYRHKKEIQKVNISLQKNVYWLLFIFLALLWLIETTSFAFWTKSWLTAITKYWWITLIFFGINYFYLLIFWKSQIYLYNRDPRILHALLDPQHRSPH